MTTALALALAYAGLASLCLGMRRHYRQVWNLDAGPVARAALRIGGWLCLALSLLASVAVWGEATGAVAWLGALSAAGFLLIFLLPYTPRLAAVLALVGPVVATVSVFVGRG